MRARAGFIRTDEKIDVEGGWAGQWIPPSLCSPRGEQLVLARQEISKVVIEFDVLAPVYYSDQFVSVCALNEARFTRSTVRTATKEREHVWIPCEQPHFGS